MCTCPRLSRCGGDDGVAAVIAACGARRFDAPLAVPSCGSDSDGCSRVRLQFAVLGVIQLA